MPDAERPTTVAGLYDHVEAALEDIRTQLRAMDDNATREYVEQDKLVARLDALERSVFGADHAAEREALSAKAAEPSLRRLVDGD